MKKMKKMELDLNVDEVRYLEDLVKENLEVYNKFEKRKNVDELYFVNKLLNKLFKHTNKK